MITSIFLQSSPRYQQALKQTDDPKQYFDELQRSGYATDPAYADKVMSVYNSDRLKNEETKLRSMRASL